MSVKIKRAYEAAAAGDGERILVDRLWPRGLTKRQAAIDHWDREVAPSAVLRRWFAHDPDRWVEFKRRYFAELDSGDAVRDLAQRARRRRITLVYGARDERYNNAVALREYLRRRYRV